MIDEGATMVLRTYKSPNVREHLSSAEPLNKDIILTFFSHKPHMQKLPL